MVLYFCLNDPGTNQAFEKRTADQKKKNLISPKSYMRTPIPTGLILQGEVDNTNFLLLSHDKSHW